jgi:uncharacterized protein YraI
VALGFAVDLFVVLCAELSNAFDDATATVDVSLRTGALALLVADRE